MKTIKNKSIKTGQNVLYYYEGILHINSLQICFSIFLTFCNTLHCILKFWEMSVEIMDNILVIYLHMFHFIAFFLSFLIWGHFKIVNLKFSGWPGEGRYPKHINWSLGFPRDQFLDPSSSPHTLHHWVPSYRHMVSHTITILMTHSSISRFDHMIQS